MCVRLLPVSSSALITLDESSARVSSAIASTEKGTAVTSLPTAWVSPEWSILTCDEILPFLSQISVSVDLNLSLPLKHADIDECEQPSSHMCDHECVNTVGSFVCRCNSGYVLAPDRLSCIPLNSRESGALEEVFRDVCLLAATCVHVVHSEVHGEVQPANECWELLLHLSRFSQHEKQPVAAEAEAGKHAATSAGKL